MKSFFQYLSTIMTTLFLDITLRVHQNINHEVHNSLTFSSTYLDSCNHIKLILLLNIVSTISIDLHISVPTLHVPKWIVLLQTNLFIHIHSRKCGNPCIFFTTPRYQCNNSYSFDIVLELYSTLLPSNDLVFHVIKIQWNFTLTVDYLT